jgi:DNA modification methylase
VIPATRIERRKVADLVPADYNPRNISERALAGLSESVRRFGLVQPIIVNERTGNVVGGHQRRKTLVAEGVAETDVVVVDLDEGEERALNVALNNQHISGEFTDDLDAMLEAIAADTPELFEALRLDDLLADLAEVEAPPPLPEDDDHDAEPEDGPPVTQRGDVWTLGRHRLICGDCRDAGDVERLLGGEQVNVAFTSPPYASQRTYDESSGFKPIRPDDYVEWFSEVQANVRAHLADDGSWFVNIKAHCEDGQRHLYVHDLTLAHVRSWGWRFVDELCWTHRGLPGSWPNRFKNAWEPVFHFSSGAVSFSPARVGRLSDDVFHAGGSVSDTNRSGNVGWHGGDVDRLSGVALPSNVVDIPNNPANHDAAHSAAFPVALPAFFIRAYSDPGDVIFDPFMGSGTTTIACEKEGRRGYGCEISAGYCDVIIRRWQAESGEAATLEDGRAFDEVKEGRGD